jgi:hypothetical protein
MVGPWSADGELESSGCLSLIGVQTEGFQQKVGK